MTSNVGHYKKVEINISQKINKAEKQIYFFSKTIQI